MIESPFKCLADIPVLRCVPESKAHALLHMLIAQPLLKGSVLAAAGRESDVLFIIVEGTVRAHSADGYRTSGLWGPGSVIGIWASGESLAPASFSMATDGAAICLPSSEVRRLGLTEMFLAYGAWNHHPEFGQPDPFPPDLITLSNLVGTTQFESALDLGAGGGRLAMLLRGVANRFTLLDLSLFALEQARERLDWLCCGEWYDTVSGDMTSLPFAESAFDLVLSRLALHEVSKPRDALHEMMRALRRGGVIALVDLAATSDSRGRDLSTLLETTLDHNFHAALDGGAVCDILEKSGFHSIVQVRTMISRPLSDRSMNGEAIADCVALLKTASSEACTALNVEWPSDDNPRWTDERLIVVARKGSL